MTFAVNWPVQSTCSFLNGAHFSGLKKRYFFALQKKQKVDISTFVLKKTIKGQKKCSKFLQKNERPGYVFSSVLLQVLQLPHLPSESIVTSQHIVSNSFAVHLNGLLVMCNNERITLNRIQNITPNVRNKQIPINILLIATMTVMLSPCYTASET